MCSCITISYMHTKLWDYTLRTYNSSTYIHNNNVPLYKHFTAWKKATVSIIGIHVLHRSPVYLQLCIEMTNTVTPMKKLIGLCALCRRSNCQLYNIIYFPNRENFAFSLWHCYDIEPYLKAVIETKTRWKTIDE